MYISLNSVISEKNNLAFVADRQAYFIEEKLIFSLQEWGSLVVILGESIII
jgi:hypothetical protein